MEFLYEANRIYAQDETGNLLAEVTFPEKQTGVCEIDHTFVDTSLRGQGIAGRLLQSAADTIRKNGKKARPVCSYAVAWFEKHTEAADLLV